ncbi:MAG: immunity 53 family protein [Gammaproteobacteria bacterium]|nr:immunity 53 family protein [Gammaproteobacteria bacterium]
MVSEGDLITATADDPGGALAALQRWYSSQCDGDWEHQLGIKIETLDNPGWMVTIDVEDTPLRDQPFSAVERTSEAREWISCRVEKNQFRGAGGPHMLGAIIEEFVQWASHAKAV